MKNNITKGLYICYKKITDSASPPKNKGSKYKLLLKEAGPKKNNNNSATVA